MGKTITEKDMNLATKQDLETDLLRLHKEISECVRCPLRQTATSPVPGLGEIGADYFLIGEAPGREEDRTKVPFVGSAGKRLNKLLALAGINPNRCYITNICRCRPPANRVPKKAERLACYVWLQQELELLKPKTIITLGATPLSLFTETGVTQLHGTQFQTDLNGRDTTIIAQYHPAAALHNPRLWAVLLDDWEHMPKKVDASYVVDKLQPALHCGTFALDTENDPDGHIGTWSIAYRDSTQKVHVTSYDGAVPMRYATDSLCVMHNAKWDKRVLIRNGMAVPSNIVDTMIAAYCLGLGRQDVKDANRSGDQMVGGLGLKYLARRHLGMQMRTWAEVHEHPELVEEYNANDSVATLLLWELWKDKLPKHFWEIDMPLLPVIMKMEDRGILVNPDFLREYALTLDAELAKIEFPVIGEAPLNPFSPKQVGDYIYNKLGITPYKFTDTKQPSTDAEVLETIDDPVVRNILRYREFFKERGTYVQNYAKGLDADGRLHCEFKQTGTATGRLSSARPNLQNVTKETDLRKLFIAPKGYKLVKADYDQLELRVFAAIAKEEVMLQALADYDAGKGEKIHKITAQKLNIEYRDAKSINFLMLFGGGAWKISQTFGVPIDQAQELITSYYRTFPGIKRYHAQMIAQAHEQRKVYNWFGRMRRLDGMFSEHWKTIKDTEREAINTPVQGTAADVVKLGMIALDRKDTPMLLQVHDELVNEVKESDAQDFGHWLKEFIPTVITIEGVKFPVEVSVGQNWKEMKEINAK